MQPSLVASQLLLSLPECAQGHQLAQMYEWDMDKNLKVFLWMPVI